MSTRVKSKSPVRAKVESNDEIEEGEVKVIDNESYVLSDTYFRFKYDQDS